MGHGPTRTASQQHSLSMRAIDSIDRCHKKNTYELCLAFELDLFLAGGREHADAVPRCHNSRKLIAPMRSKLSAPCCASISRPHEVRRVSGTVPCQNSTPGPRPAGSPSSRPGMTSRCPPPAAPQDPAGRRGASAGARTDGRSRSRVSARPLPQRRGEPAATWAEAGLGQELLRIGLDAYTG